MPQRKTRRMRDRGASTVLRPLGLRRAKRATKSPGVSGKPLRSLKGLPHDRHGCVDALSSYFVGLVRSVLNATSAWLRTLDFRDQRNILD